MSQIVSGSKSKHANKIYLSMSDKIDISKLFTREFFVFTGIDDVHIHKIARSTISFDLSNKPSTDAVDTLNTSDGSIANSIAISRDTFKLPEPGVQHRDLPFTKPSDFEIQRPIEPEQIMKGRGILNDIGSFFSGFLYRTSKPTSQTHPLKPDAINNNDLEITFGKNVIVSLLSMPPSASNIDSIYRLNILGGIEYSDLETLSLCIDRQNEYMEKMGVQINKWRLDHVYKINDKYVCFDVENISEIDDSGNGNSSMNDRKKEFMNMIIGDEYSKLKGTREGMRLL